MPFELVDVHDSDQEVGSLSVSIQSEERTQAVRVHAIQVRVGPQPHGIIRRIRFSPSLAATPLVFCQTNLQGEGFADIFSVNVVQTTANGISLKIDRLDGGPGWGADLFVNVLLVVPV